ncbi:anti-sigma factor [Actinomarinicola tropica]|nr:anti-sigma factor [Actinomarinicola tropica]
MSDDLHHLAAAYALDALEPDERARFEAHLAGCPDCAADIDELRGTAGELAGATAVEPPPELRSRVLAAAATTPQEPRELARAGGGRATSGSRPLVPLAAAAVLLLVALAAGLVARDAVVDRDRATDLLAVLAAPDVELVTLESAGPPGAVRVAWSASTDGAVVIGSDLPDPGDDRVYELWSLGRDGPTSAGLLEPDTEGRLERRVALPVEPVDGWGITIEPAGGSPQPTGDILYAG